MGTARTGTADRAQRGPADRPWAGCLIITAAWTGARWGELAGLQRHNLHLPSAQLTIDPEIGNLLEIDGHFELGPPMTDESARTITLPPFLIPLLDHHLTTHQHPHAFVTTEGQLLRRSNFSHRCMRPGRRQSTDTPSTLIAHRRRCATFSPPGGYATAGGTRKRQVDPRGRKTRRTSTPASP